MLNRIYSLLDGFPILYTTQPATACAPCIFELSKQSIHAGMLSKDNICCNSLKTRVARCCGLSLSSCLSLSNLYCRTFCIAKSSSFFLSPLRAICTCREASKTSGMNGTITSFVLLLSCSRNSIIPNPNSSSLASSIFLLYSIVNPWVILPLCTCSMEIYTRSSCSSYPNTSTSPTWVLVITVLLLNCSSKSILCFISAASS